MVFTILNKRCDKLTYLNDNYEIDFFCEEIYYQVAYEINDEKIRKRELHSFKHFNKDSKHQNILITYEMNEQLDYIKIISLENFIFSIGIEKRLI